MNSLADKAHLFEQYAENHFIDLNGVVYSMLNEATDEPWTADDLTADDKFIEVPGFEVWEVFNYENSGMTTGAYLAAQSYRWQVTQSDDALERARRSFRGLQWIYEIGRAQEEGLFPKTYGGRISHEISTDQYLYAIKGMMAYLSIASEEDAAAIRHMIPYMVDFWVKREYRHDYFNFKDMLWPLGRFPSLLYAAHAVSGDQKYLDEAERINSQHRVYLNPVESQFLVRAAENSPLRDAEKRVGDSYLACWITECSAMDIMELDECLLLSDSYREHWLRSMKLSWDEAKLCLAENGLARGWTAYNPHTGDSGCPSPQYLGDPDDFGWDFMQWVGGFLSARSTMLARVGIHVAKWLPTENAIREVEQILHGASLEQMRHCIDTDGKQILPQHQYMCRWVDGDALTNWLWAYWQGRYEGILQ